jgi:hypothetical protein
MSQYRLDQPLPEAGVALLADDEDIGEIGKGRLIGDDAGKADLRALSINAEHERMRDRTTQSI